MMHEEEEIRWARERYIELALQYYKILNASPTLYQLLGTTKVIAHYVSSGNIEPIKKVKVKIDK